MQEQKKDSDIACVRLCLSAVYLSVIVGLTTAVKVVADRQGPERGVITWFMFGWCSAVQGLEFDEHVRYGGLMIWLDECVVWGVDEVSALDDPLSNNAWPSIST